MEEFIKIESIQFKYNDNKIILNDISLEINKGEFIAILGHNGCGKSTLAKHLNSLFIPLKGRVLVDNLDTKSDLRKIYDIRSKVGLVLQNPDNQIVASIVEEDVAFGPENLGIKASEIRKRVDESLKCVGMYKYKNYDSYKLSGGQKQRIAIAGILAMKPKCIVLDEPTSMLDPLGKEEVLNTIRKLNKEKKITIVLITHFMEEAILANRIIVLDKGSILTQGSPKEVFSKIDLLKRHGLGVPQSIELIDKLNKLGFNLLLTSLSVKECVDQIKNVITPKERDN